MGKKSQPPMAIQTSNGCSHVVGVFNIKVLLLKEDGEWFAQGLDIDYATQGRSIRDVQTRFEKGLTGTIRAHVRKYGTIEGVLKVAPEQHWKEFFGRLNLGKLYSQQSAFYIEAEDMTFQCDYRVQGKPTSRVAA